jgi:GT2 family glycosyltransferase
VSGRTASVIVVSRDRPAELCRCLKGLAQLDHPAFEIVVVADAPGLAALEGAGLDRGIKTARCDAANISEARNLGIALAAGEALAFIDDDAVPEPTWLARLTAPLAEVAAAGGFVRGRNGISYQWRGRWVDRLGFDTEISPWGDAPRVFSPEAGRAAKLQGTNMAVRRDALAAIGGFDPAFRFYLDDADLSLRLAASGHAVAFVPLAEVHHGFAASPRRRADRVPQSLHEIGASLAVFLARHAGQADRAGARQAVGRAERRRLVDHMVAGRIEPRDVARLFAGFGAGFAEGEARPPSQTAPIPAAEVPFLPFCATRRPMHRLAGRPWQARRLRAEAARLAEGGIPATLFLFGPSARPHWMRFTDGGWWEQTGGIFGRSDRDGPRFRFTSFAARLAAETARIAPVRRFSGDAAGSDPGR